MTTLPVVRPKITQELRLRIYQLIVDNPEIGSREIIQTLIKEDAGNVVHFFSAPVNETLTLERQVEIYKGKTKAERSNRLKKLIRDRKGEFAINLGVITRIKNSLNKGHAKTAPEGAIYGASNLGYVVEMAMDANRAARWLYPRVAQIQHECLAWNKCGQFLGTSDSPERKRAADNARRWINKAMVYREVKNVADGIRDRFLH